MSACGGGGSSDPNDNTYYLDGVKVELNDVVASAKYKVGFGGNGSATINGTYTSIGSLTASAEGYTETISSGQLSGSTTINADGTWHDTDGTSGTWTKDGNKVYFVGSGNVAGAYVSNNAELKLGEVHNYYSTVNIEGYNLTADVTVDATELPNFDVVNGYASDNFFITDEGTGSRAYLNNNQKAEQEAALTPEVYEAINEIGATDFYNDVANAHGEGWTGLDLFIVTPDTNNVSELIAPNATFELWNDTSLTYACIDRLDDYACGSTDGITVGIGEEIELTHRRDGERSDATNANVAAGVALVWHKFDTLTDDQVQDLVNETADGDIFNLGAALSPVGNLN